MERHGSARAVTVEVVVHAALGVDDEGDLHPHEVKLAAEAVFDISLDGRDRPLRLFRVEKRRVVGREIFLQILVASDARAGEVGLLIENFRRVLRHETSFLWARGEKPGLMENMVPAGSGGG